jgi:thiosulfate/3-mercaptopyruvate sulfurtransferase
MEYNIAMNYTTLISPQELNEHLHDAHWAIIDSRSQLKDRNYGRRSYEQAHISGAIFADLIDDLAGPIVLGKTSRHPLPSIEFAAQKFSAWGIDAQSQVVAYDDLGGALSAARVWWMLRWLGHDRVAVLDGGWQAWQAAGYETRGGIETRSARMFTPQVRPEMLVNAQDVIDSLHDQSLQLFDARTVDRYRGENEIIDPVAGHIPGAKSAPYPEHLENGVFKSSEELRAKYEALLGDKHAEQTAFYCGSGVTAAHNVLAIKYAGLGNAKLYAGSWSEWITDPNRPIKVGNET